jgi:hypothetical protein
VNDQSILDADYHYASGLLELLKCQKQEKVMIFNGMLLILLPVKVEKVKNCITKAFPSSIIVCSSLFFNIFLVCTFTGSCGYKRKW